MPVEVILPKVDMDMESGTIEAWKVAEGEAVTEGQLIFEIGTSKAVMEVEAPASGIIRRISAKPGETVAVGTPVAWIYGLNEPLSATPIRLKSAANDASPALAEIAARHEEPQSAEPLAAIRATPLARRLARQQGIALDKVTGTGPRGRIGGADIQAFAAKAAQ
jgi:pyruvate dehydrogenase E2 component (dihydrolipoamide acetyltransferase)